MWFPSLSQPSRWLVTAYWPIYGNLFPGGEYWPINYWPYPYRYWPVGIRPTAVLGTIAFDQITMKPLFDLLPISTIITFTTFDQLQGTNYFDLATLTTKGYHVANGDINLQLLLSVPNITISTLES